MKNLHSDPLPYTGRLDSRALDDIDLVIVHCTELPDLETAREYGERIQYTGSQTGSSGHYYIDRSGRIESWVEPDRVAHHTRGYNNRSIGIELVNTGRYPDWYRSDRQTLTEPYPSEQIDALICLLESLRDTLPRLRWIAGHADLDKDMIPASDSPSWMVHRKVDPGPLFPWKLVLAASGLFEFPGAASE
jgi:N-acetylmuramoyl-L-alanine amidase